MRRSKKDKRAFSKYANRTKSINVSPMIKRGGPCL